MIKKPFVTKEQVEEIVKTYPTPFHLYDEKGIRENAKALKEAFSCADTFEPFGSIMTSRLGKMLDKEKNVETFFVTAIKMYLRIKTNIKDNESIKLFIYSHNLCVDNRIGISCIS